MSRPTIRLTADGMLSPEVNAAEWLSVETRESGLREYLNTLRRHDRIIIGVFLGALFVASLVVSAMPRRYTATSTVLIEPRRPQALSLKDLSMDSQEASPDDSYYETQYQILKSHTLASEVIQQLRLDQTELFKSRGYISWMKGQIDRMLSMIVRMDGGPLERRKTASVIVERYLEALTIKPEQRSDIVAVSFTSRNADLSARIVNAHVSAYIQRAFEIHGAMSLDAEKFLSKKLGELKERLKSSENALDAFRRKHGDASFSPDGTPRLLIQRFSEIDNELNRVEDERISLQAEESVMHHGNGTLLSLAGNNEIVRNLTDKIATLSAEYAEMSNRFTPDYHPLADLGAKLSAMKTRRAEAIAGVIQRNEAEDKIDALREQELTRERDTMRAQILAFGEASLQNAVLQREVDINSQLYKSVLERLNEIEVAAEVPVTNISVVDRAKAPIEPSSPKTKLIVAVSGFLGLFGAFGLSFLVDHLDDRFEDRAAVERHLRLPTLGVVPDFKQLRGRRYSYSKARLRADSPNVRNDARELLVTGDGHSVAGEIYRSIRTALLYSCPSVPPRSILVTSASPGEGKTTSSINVGLAFAQMGARTLLIDADLRSSRCHKVLGLQNERGLSEVLTGQLRACDVIQPTKASPLYIVTAGSSPANPGVLLGSSKMREVLSVFAREFDHIVIDSPPILAVNDAVMLSTVTDGVLLIIGRPVSRALVSESCSRLAHVRAHFLGVVMNGADITEGAFLPS